jgi:N-acetylneuraminic acid mutarotase
VLWYEPDTRWQIVAAADFDGGGKASLLWRHTETGAVYLMPMDGLTARPGAVVWLESSPAWRIVACDDFAGDGRAGILWWNSGTGRLYLLRMDGTQVLSGTPIPTGLGPDWRVAGSGDFDGDGTADLLWRNQGSGDVYLMPMYAGQPQPGIVIFGETRPEWQIAAVGDYDGDGKADLVWWDSRTGQAWQMLMDGFRIKAANLVHTEPDTRWSPVPTLAPPAPVLPGKAIVTVGARRSFSCGAENAVIWSATGGSIDPDSGAWVAPATYQTVRITATALDDGTRIASTLVTVVAAPRAGALVPARSILSAGSGTTLVPSCGNGAAVIGSAGPGSSDVTDLATDGVAAATGALDSSRTFTLTVTNAAGDSATASCAVAVVAAPVATSLVPGQTLLRPGTGTTLLPTFGRGRAVITSDLPTPRLLTDAVSSGVAVGTGALSATQSFTLTVSNAAGDSARATCLVNVGAPPAQPVISVPARVTALTSGWVASVVPQDQATYAWTITGGSFDGGASGASVRFTPGASGSVQLACVVSDPYGPPASGSASATIVAPAATPVIGKPTAVTAGKPGYLASIAAQAQSTYAWTIQNGSIDGAATGTSISFTPGPSGLVLLSCVVSNAAGTPAAPGTAQVVIVAPAVTPVINGPLAGNGSFLPFPSFVTAGQTYSARTPLQVLVSLKWSITGGIIQGADFLQALSFTAGASGTLQLSCVATDGAGTPAPTGYASATIVPAPVATSLTASSLTPAFGSTFTLTPVFADGTGSIDQGVICPATSVASAAITANWSGGKTYTLTVSNAAGDTATQTVTVTPTPVLLGAISAASPTLVVNSVTAFSVPVSGGALNTVTWTASAGTINSATGSWTAPATAQSVTITATSVDDSSKSVSVSVNVTAFPPPAKPKITILRTEVIAGSTGLGASIANPVAGVSYAWTLTNQNPPVNSFNLTSGVNGTSVRYDAIAAGSFTVQVQASNSGGGSMASDPVPVSVWPVSVADAAMPTSAHPNDAWMQASVPSLPGATYVWTISNSTGGQGATLPTISSDPSAASIRFNAGNATGSFTFDVSATVTPLVGAPYATFRQVQIKPGTWLVKDGIPALPRNAATATVLANGRVLVAGGLGSDHGPLAAAELYDPTGGFWILAGGMTSGRSSHTATLLTDGTVLAAGGTTGSQSLRNSERYDPASNRWSAGNDLNAARALHTATRLLDGKVLVTGGWSGSNPLASSEIYDPGPASWSFTPAALAMARYSHTATLLRDGSVLVVGGTDGNGPLSGTERYHPDSQTWSVAKPLLTGRSGHTATLLADGTVLVAGGTDSPFQYVRNAEIYDSDSDTWSLAGSLATGRTDHTATRLADGSVVLAGGFNSTSLASVERYDPAGNAWTTLAGLALDRFQAIAALLPDGRLLIEGGQSSTLGALTAPEIFAGTWTRSQAPGYMRSGHSATLLPAQGQVLVVGGAVVGGLSSCLRYDPVSRAWAPAASLVTGRFNHTVTLLGNGKVLVAGGLAGGSSTLRSAEIYDPVSDAWSSAGNMLTARSGHTATLLASGKVMVTGGIGLPVFPAFVGSPLASAELYDPASNTWSAAPAMAEPRQGHSATPVPNSLSTFGGGLLVLGGTGTTTPLATGQSFSITFNSWAPTPLLPYARTGHTATPLANGKVLVLGRTSPAGYPTADLFNPGTGSWAVSRPPNMATDRSGHQATLLLNGDVLVTGGDDSSGPLASFEIYRPSTNLWLALNSTSMLSTRTSHTATRLPDGSVLAAFGANGTFLTEIFVP